MAYFPTQYTLQSTVAHRVSDAGKQWDRANHRDPHQGYREPDTDSCWISAQYHLLAI